jgi:hypothetical protein
MTGEKTKTEGTSPLVLQARDELIMAFIAEFSLLSRSQLQKLLDFPCTTRINIRLKKLYEHGFLSRRSLPTSLGKPQASYYLGHRGVINVCQNTGIDPLRLEIERKHIQDQKDLFLNHQLFLNEMRIAFTLAIAEHPHMSLERWIKERDCFIEFPMIQGGHKTLRPDGCLCLTYLKKLYSFFIEVDCSTMSNNRLRAKANVYLDYARSGHSLQDFGFKYFRVLIITRTQERLKNLKITIEALTNRIFYFAVRDQILHESVLDRIWSRAGSQTPFFLLED